MRICLMVEGQEGVGWDEWRALAGACEEHGLEGLFRSDHYLSPADETLGSLDAWTTLAAIAAVTSRIRLGTLVSPATFRHPSLLAKAAVTVDHVSGGRVEVGMGTGWMEAEHERYGFPFPPLRQRMDDLAEQLAIVRGHWGPGPFEHRGERYVLAGLDARPKPVQARLPLIMGGEARPRAAALAARYADEYNLVWKTVDECAAPQARLREACTTAGRDPATLPCSLMTLAVVGRDRAELDERLARLAARPGGSSDPGPAPVIGTLDQAAERLRDYERAGIGRVMLQHLLHDDVEMVALLGELARELR